MRILASLLLLSLIVVLSCTKESTYIENTGQAQGSTYQIKYLSPNGADLGDDIVDIFQEIDLSMSTYIPTSLISQINKGDTTVKIDAPFEEVLTRSIEIANETNGQFDPTIGPLVRFWGFGFDEVKTDIDPEEINRIKESTGYESIDFENHSVTIPKGFNIDFNAIAQGFTVDYIARFLESKKVEHYMVEVGGEVKAKGVNDKNNYWKIGVDKPQEQIDTEDRFQFILTLQDRALVTSGNYRKFWVDKETGVRYSHTIDPKTGYPARNRLLSASILGDSAMDADAYATACMVKGLEGCKELLKQHTELEGYLVFDIGDNEWGTYISPGFKEFIVE
ncbi:MAG: FAD:protein FMN transferase [Balneola sp.]